MLVMIESLTIFKIDGIHVKVDCIFYSHFKGTNTQFKWKYFYNSRRFALNISLTGAMNIIIKVCFST
jgi:hypothetical protein